MRFTAKSIIVLTLVFCLIGAVPAAAVEPAQPNKDISAGAMAADILLLRPLGIATTVAGTILYMVSIPFSAPAGNHLQVREKLVQEPARYTFQRQLGDI